MLDDSDMTSSDTSFSGDISLSLTSFSAEEELLQIKKLTEGLETKFQNDSEKLFMCGIIKQQLKLMAGPSPTSSPPTTAELLPRPVAFTRSTQKRTYRVKNFGVMTSDEILGKHQGIADQKGRAEVEKENRKAQRLQKQQLTATIRNMKKEKTEENRKRRAEEAQAASSQPKRRGRPPKAAKVVEALKPMNR